MAFNIENFISSIHNDGVIRTNRFEVTFSIPEYLRGRYSNDPLLTLRCGDAQLPGVGLASVDGPPRYGYGPIEEIPYGPIFDNLTLVFLLDKGSMIHSLFYDWVNCIVNFQSKGQSRLGQDSENAGPVRNMAAWEVGYKNKYVTDIHISVYDVDQSPILRATAFRAHPKLIPPIDLSWQSNDEVARWPVSFAYTDFQVQYRQSSDSYPGNPNVPSPFG